ncbi:hypothetical protein F1188_11020 [Roseospira marina]|uniref:Pectate lyase superfamily protein domain-containing protein n=1 Tax=Roseospira marina TaxID=140057 RepID=A0A5M6IB06_9PROT|nr:hypothetical protein [Roseospira marina]KAA5605426.1 hypothetical protein F1188_11020 [Roseospira marina]MBB4314580.1 hypothetical protein [Roseospira marina]MBB5088858.1 hypothetical protein [Roseospira marina]
MPAQRIFQFDTWQPGYAGSTVYVRDGSGALAAVFTDEALTQPAPNPQILIQTTDTAGVSYGKFAEPIYTAADYALDIDTTQQTGVQRLPLTTLAGQDASQAEVTATNGTVARPLAARAADVIRALDHGALDDTSTAANTATLQAAIGIAAAAGAGAVLVPAGTYQINAITIPQGVILTGAGRGATILVSQIADDVVTIAGDDAGLADLTLDGVNVVAGGIGIASQAVTGLILRHVQIARFATAMRHQGGFDHRYTDVSVYACAEGPRFLGDAAEDVGNTFTGLHWVGGKVSATTTGAAVAFEADDRPVDHNALVHVEILDNIGTAGITLVGAQFTTLERCAWEGNVNILSVEDCTNVDLPDREVISLRVLGGSMADGTIALDGLCQDIVFESVEIVGADFVMTTPVHNILLKNCTEYGARASGSEPRKLTRFRDIHRGGVIGLTTDGDPVVAWALTLNPGEVAMIEVRATGRALNNATEYAVYHTEQAARRPGATLPYDNRTTAFSIGSTVQGADSGATALIVADDSDDTTGTLTLYDIIGTFEDNEIITETGETTGSAQVNGALGFNAVALAGSTVSHVSETGGTASTWGGLSFAASGPEIQVKVDGDANDAVEWRVDCRVTI